MNESMNRNSFFHHFTSDRNLSEDRNGSVTLNSPILFLSEYRSSKSSMYNACGHWLRSQTGMFHPSVDCKGVLVVRQCRLVLTDHYLLTFLSA
jgi:hypothetical protein